MKNNEKGFSAIETIIVLVVIGLIASAGWLIMDRQHSNSSQNTISQTEKHQNNAQDNNTENLYANWQEASFELINASFKYPKYLKMTHELMPNAASNTEFETYVLQASDKTRIMLSAFHFRGGFTGDEPKYLIEDVITSNGNTNSREFSSIIYKNSDGVYDSAYIVDSSQTKYKTGEETQIFLNAFSVKPNGSNSERSKLAISISGQKYQTYKTLDGIKAMGAYKDVQLFINSLNAPSDE